MKKKLERILSANKVSDELLNSLRGGKTIMDSSTRQSSSFQHCTGDCYDTTTATFDDDGYSNGSVCSYVNCP
jgi:hypothetical protein